LGLKGAAAPLGLKGGAAPLRKDQKETLVSFILDRGDNSLYFFLQVNFFLLRFLFLNIDFVQIAMAPFSFGGRIFCFFDTFLIHRHNFCANIFSARLVSCVLFFGIGIL
jgi:hypothetical protein